MIKKAAIAALFFYQVFNYLWVIQVLEFMDAGRKGLGGITIQQRAGGLKNYVTMVVMLIHVVTGNA